MISDQQSCKMELLEVAMVVLSAMVGGLLVACCKLCTVVAKSGLSIVSEVLVG